jgi:hypothetical protein
MAQSARCAFAIFDSTYLRHSLNYEQNMKKEVKTLLVIFTKNDICLNKKRTIGCRRSD